MGGRRSWVAQLPVLHISCAVCEEVELLGAEAAVGPGSVVADVVRNFDEERTEF